MVANNLIITEFAFKNALGLLNEVDDVESDIADLTDRLDDFSDILDDDVSRVGYIRQLTAELLEYLSTLNSELAGQVEIPVSTEMMDKIMGRRERKRYYMSKFRL